MLLFGLTFNCLYKIHITHYSLFKCIDILKILIQNLVLLICDLQKFKSQINSRVYWDSQYQIIPSSIVMPSTEKKHLLTNI